MGYAYIILIPFIHIIAIILSPYIWDANKKSAVYAALLLFDGWRHWEGAGNHALGQCTAPAYRAINFKN